jgi:hypothetical protein
MSCSTRDFRSILHAMATTNERRYNTTTANLGHHSKLLTIGDCTKDEIRTYYKERLLSDIPKSLQKPLDFDKIHDYFGGKLAHWSDYLTEYQNADGNLTRTPFPFSP